MITFDNVTVRENGQTILNGVSFSIAPQERAVFFGKSGAGKTTILTTLIGAFRPAAGTILFSGNPVTGSTVHELRRAVSYISQQPVMGADRVEDALLLPFTFKANRSGRPARETIERILSRLHLEPGLLEKESEVLSGGEKQRVAIARELLQNKQVFILDEITANLDPESKAAVLELFGSSPFTLLSVSHDPDWLKMCTSFYRVAQGAVTGPVERPDYSEMVR